MNIEASNGHPDMDYAQHRATYAGFLKVSIISMIAIIALLVGMAIFLT